ncbi:MAG: hypothetical protein IJW45_01720 [Oscillospiraceae bacterium]|nr:hypothetical protein [Oscillospiraceae bacterium]
MDYRLLPDHRHLRRIFTDKFLLPYSSFTATHEDWISGLCEPFDEAYYETMFMWDKMDPNAKVIPFSHAMDLLDDKPGEVTFLTEAPPCRVKYFCKLDSQIEFVAAADPKELSRCIAQEWFDTYELEEQGLQLADPILPDDLYVFDDTFSWCLVFTHETNESRSPHSRLCLLIDNETPAGPAVRS